jgi:hypothetical protein
MREYKQLLLPPSLPWGGWGGGEDCRNLGRGLGEGGRTSPISILQKKPTKIVLLSIPFHTLDKSSITIYYFLEIRTSQAFLHPLMLFFLQTNSMSKGQPYLNLQSTDNLNDFSLFLPFLGGKYRGYLNVGSPPPIYFRGVGGGGG